MMKKPAKRSCGTNTAGESWTAVLMSDTRQPIIKEVDEATIPRAHVMSTMYTMLPCT